MAAPGSGNDSPALPELLLPMGMELWGLKGGKTLQIPEEGLGTQTQPLPRVCGCSGRIQGKDQNSWNTERKPILTNTARKFALSQALLSQV